MNRKLLLVIGALLIAPKLFSQGNWVQQDLLSAGYNANNWVQFVDAVDTNICWGLSVDRNGQTNPLQEFVRTIDGGATWTFGPITNAAGCAASSIMALNADTAWVAMFTTTGGGKILRTNDGGQTWTHQSTALFSAPAGFPNIVHFFDANNGVCMGDPNGGYFEIYTTSDGGTNWVRTPQANIATNQPGEFGITDVYTVNGSTLWFGTNQGRIYKTIDGGLNWTVASSPYTGFIGGLAFKDANYGLATESDLTTVNTDLIVTTDGGATWNILNCTTGNMAQKQSITYVPGSDSTFVITTPYNRTTAPLRDFGSAFSTNNGNQWYVVSNNTLLFSDNDFASPNGGWAGGLTDVDPIFGLFRDPVMYKWTGPLFIPNNDAITKTIDLPNNTGTSTQNPKATFLNNGLNTNTFNVTMTITGGYTSTKTITNLAFNQTQQVAFDPWTPASTGSYTVTVYTSLTGDVIPTNDTLVKNVTVYPEFLNYGWISRDPFPSNLFSLGGAFDYDGIYPNGVGSLFMMGGTTQATQSLLNTKYDVDNGIWSAQSPIPSSKYHASAHRVGDNIYYLGGYSTGGAPDANTYIYNIPTDTWTTGAPMPNPVGDYGSGLYKDSLIYVICGFNGAADQNSVQIYNTYTNSWSTGANFPNVNRGIRGSIYENKIVVAGGFSGAVTDVALVGTIDVTNPSNINWAFIAPYPGGPAFRLSAGVTFGKTIPLVVFIEGDPTGSGLSSINETWAYDLSLSSWLIGPPKPTAVNNTGDFVGTVYNDSLYLTSVSGFNGTTETDVNEWLNMGSATVLSVKNDVINSGTLVISPNPTNGVFKVKIPRLKNYTLTVYNSIGVKIIDRKIENKTFEEINLGKAANGIYQIRIENGTESYSSKVVVSD